MRAPGPDLTEGSCTELADAARAPGPHLDHCQGLPARYMELLLLLPRHLIPTTNCVRDTSQTVWDGGSMQEQQEALDQVAMGDRGGNLDGFCWSLCCGPPSLGSLSPGYHGVLADKDLGLAPKT